jgi:hypothetical protein
MSSSDEEDWSSEDYHDDGVDGGEDVAQKGSTKMRNRKKRNGTGKEKPSGSTGSSGSSITGMIDVGAKKLMEKYSRFSGGRTILSQDESKQWTPEMTQSLGKMLQNFLMKTSKVMRPLTNSGNGGKTEIYVSDPHIVDDCVRFTIEPCFPKFDPSMMICLDAEIRKHLPGFSFYIGNPAGTHSKNLRLLPPGGSKTFSVTVPAEGMQPYFEFRPLRFRNRHFILGLLLVLLLASTMVMVYSFYASYSREGYSLWTGLYEVFAALGVL